MLIFIVLFILYVPLCQMLSFLLVNIGFGFYWCIGKKEVAYKVTRMQPLLSMPISISFLIFSIVFSIKSLNFYKHSHNLMLEVFLIIVILVSILNLMKNIIWFFCLQNHKSERFYKVGDQIYRKKEEGLTLFRKDFKERKQALLNNAKEVQSDHEISC
jgi:hypothetical protein